VQTGAIVRLMSDACERITHDGKLLALIVRSSFHEPGVHFFTPPELSQQLAHLRHRAGHIIAPHLHNRVRREVQLTQEVLVIRTGRLRVDFYDEQRRSIRSTVLGPGDVILLAAGGHGFEVLEDVEMIEVKQGPYAGDGDRTRFDPVVE
jgi:mannose-6-phosphate isomerase-like protein (cupin superfamily)